jgi:predicted PurR-regulated permease PerM
MVSTSGTARGADSDPSEPDAVGPVRLRFSSYSVVRAVLVVVVALVLLALVRSASTPLWWLAIAAVIAAMFQPGIVFLRRYMPGWLAIVIVLIVVIGVSGLVGYRGFDEIQSQFQILRDSAVQTAVDIQGSKQFGQVATEFGLTEKVRSAFAGSPILGGGTDTATAVQSAASSGGALFAIAMLALLLLVFGRRLVQSAIGQISDVTVEARVRRVVMDSYTMASSYAWMMAARAVVIGVVTGAAAAMLGWQAPTAIGGMFAVLSLLPGIGIVIAALPFVAFEAVTSVPVAIIGGGVAIGVQLADVLFMQHVVERHSLRLGPGLTLIATIIGLQLYGIGGAMVMLAVVLGLVALFRTLTAGYDDAFTATRALVDVPDLSDAIDERGTGTVHRRAPVEPGS